MHDLRKVSFQANNNNGSWAGVVYWAISPGLRFQTKALRSKRSIPTKDKRL